MADQGEWTFPNGNLADIGGDLSGQTEGNQNILDDIDGKIVLANFKRLTPCKNANTLQLLDHLIFFSVQVPKM